MAQRELDRSQWDKYTSSLSERLRKEKVRISLGGLDLERHVKADDVVLRGITYDRRGDALEIDTEHLSYRIERPQRLVVVESDAGFERLEIIDAEGCRRVLQLERALALPGRRG